jgi:hypothetical protein
MTNVKYAAYCRPKNTPNNEGETIFISIDNRANELIENTEKLRNPKTDVIPEDIKQLVFDKIQNEYLLKALPNDYKILWLEGDEMEQYLE